MMENNGQSEKRTSLMFEIASSDSDTDDRADNKVEISLIPETPSGEPQAREPETETIGFSSDAVQFRPTYVPRFTAASLNYRMQDSAQRVSGDKTEAGEKERAADDVDPIAEIGEDSSVEKLVVAPSPKPLSDGYLDESMKIYKFKAPEVPTPAPEPEPVPETPAVAWETPDVSAEPQREEPEPTPEAPVPEKASEPERTAPRRIFTPIPREEERSEDEPIAEIDRGSKGNSREFKTSIERDIVKDKFIDTLISIRIRIAFAIIVALGALLLECLIRFESSILDSLGMIGRTEAVVDILIVTALSLIALPEIFRAFSALFGGRPTPELMLPVSYLMLVGYSATVLAAGESNIRFMTFSLLFALQVTVALFASYLKMSAAFSAFKIASRGEVKRIVETRLTRTLVRENMALDGVIDEYSSRTARVFKTAFVSDFFYHASRDRENKNNSVLILAAPLLLALITGAITYFVTDSLYPLTAAYEALALVFLVTVPAFTMLTHKLPLNHTVGEARGERGTFIGEGAIYDLSDTDVVTYDDTDMFGKEDVSLKKVHLYGKVFNTAKAMKEMYSLFSVVGGPLCEVFSSSLDRKCSHATDVRLENDGISGVFEGHTVMAGTEEFMRRHGVQIPADDYKTKTFASDSTKVMYGAEDGEVYVKFFIRYSFSEEFTMLLPELKRQRVTPLIYTRDPNIDCELLRMLTLGDDIIRVVKLRDTASRDKVYRKLTSGTVSLGDRNDVVGTVLLAKRYRAFQSLVSVAELIAAGVGALIGVTLAFVLLGRLSVIPSLALALWQIASCVALHIGSRISFKAKTKRKG